MRDGNKYLEFEKLFKPTYTEIFMSLKLILQLHVHSDRSHDCDISIKKYVEYIEKTLEKNEFAILGIVDHNVLPIRIKEAVNLSTKKVLVIPGIQWKIHKTIFQALRKLCTRREILTLGEHDDLENYIENKTFYKVLKNQEILGNFKESEFLNYISKKKNLILVVPHPRHFGIDYYGRKEIKDLNQKLKQRRTNIPFFIEVQTGYDPFPRIFTEYRKYYKVLGGSDAHEIKSFFKTNSLFSVETSLNCDKKMINLWQKAIRKKDVKMYEKVIGNIFHLLIKRNKAIIIKKYYIRSILHFLGSIFRFCKRRFENFPNNLTR